MAKKKPARVQIQQSPITRERMDLYLTMLATEEAELSRQADEMEQFKAIYELRLMQITPLRNFVAHQREINPEGVAAAEAAIAAEREATP